MNLSLPKTSAGWMIGGLSLVVLLAVAVLLLGPRYELPTTWNVSFLAPFNAALNGIVTILLGAGYALIRRGRPDAHRRVMVGAFLLSALFLFSYVIYHVVAGSTPFTGQGWIRPVYFTILISHIILSAVVLPLAMTALYRGWTEQISLHRSVARWALPIWLYTSVSGVAVYLLLYHWPA